jgi:hypothetical protein
VGVYGGPKVSPDGLLFSLDVANRKGISPLGCTGFNGAAQLAKNLISPTDAIIDANGVRLGNLSYYTAFAIDYPEGSYGGSAANRDGITPGYNVTSGTKTFDFGRALNYAVYNNPTQSWVKTTVYDSYVGTAAVDTFVAEYATAVATYPDAIHIVSGSHRDSFHTTAQYNILKDLGAPSNVDSIINFSSPEWILVGKPGLGAGNAYGWVFQNYTTNPDQVAHLNFGLPIYGGVNNYLQFDGVDDYVSVSSISVSTFTYQGWVYNTPSGNSGDFGYFHTGGTFGLAISEGGNHGVGGGSITGDFYYYNSSNAVVLNYNLSPNVWVNVASVINGSSKTLQLYINGSLQSTTNVTNTQSSITEFGRYSGNDHYFNGRVSNTQIYNRALTAQEIQQNYNATRGRYGI